MALTIVISHLLPPESVKLGRFITSIDHPYHIGYHDPPADKPPTSIVTRRDSYYAQHQIGQNARFGPVLTSVFSAGFSKRVKTKIEVAADQVVTYALGNSDQWFDVATSLRDTRVWIERAIDRGADIYMVVGFHALTNASIIYEDVHGQDVMGQIALTLGPLPEVGVKLPLESKTGLSVGGEGQDHNGIRSGFKLPGEQICALQYRKLRHKWLSSNRMGNWRLSKLPRWSSLERGRGEEDGEEDIIEVETEAVSIDELEGEWDKQSIEGETLCLRTDATA